MNHRLLLLQAFICSLHYRTKTTSHAAEVNFFSKNINSRNGNRIFEPSNILLNRLRRQLKSYFRPKKVKVESSYRGKRLSLRAPRPSKPKNKLPQNARRRKYRATNPDSGSYQRTRGNRGDARRINPPPISPPPPAAPPAPPGSYQRQTGNRGNAPSSNPPPISPPPPTAPPTLPSYRFEKIDKSICADTEDTGFGYMIVLSEQGKRLAIAAPDHNGPNGTGSGMVQVYENNSGTWIQIGSLYGRDEDATLGIGLSLSSDGNYLSAAELINNEERFTASVYKFNTNNGWSIEEEYAGANDISLSNDASRVALGKSDVMQLFNLGVAPEIGEVGGDYDTVQVVLSGDGKVVAMHYIADQVPSNYRGTVKVYKYNDATSSMSMLGSAIQGSEHYSFGSYVSLSYDGGTIAIGGDNYAQVLTFNDAAGGTSWEQKGNNIVGIGDSTDYGAVRVSLTDAGDRIIVGYPRSENINQQQQGGAVVFEFHDNSWKQIGDVVGGPNSLMGFDVSISSEGSFFAVSSPFANNGNALVGCAEVYQIVRN